MEGKGLLNTIPHTWGVGTDRLQPQVLGVIFAVVVRLGHHRSRECHVTYMTGLIAISVLTVLLKKSHAGTFIIYGHKKSKLCVYIR